MMLRSALMAVLMLCPSLVWADGISGLWKVADESAWIEVDMEAGTGTVVRNDEYPDRVGRVLLKDIVADESEEGLWRGQVLPQNLSGYRKAEIRVTGAGSMMIKGKFAFFSRTIEWLRVKELPAEGAPAADR